MQSRRDFVAATAAAFSAATTVRAAGDYKIVVIGLVHSHVLGLHPLRDDRSQPLAYMVSSLKSCKPLPSTT